nr:PREDICTED: large neutral amino acids transporter small subunit 2-like [Latimeria chalumnae]|eukprot:XP_014351673.1 PREDICTED: large neutral amino acids transporter small subunit 2-like [Latimeria chalumnae]
MDCLLLTINMYLRLWLLSVIVYPGGQVVIALTFAEYLLYLIFPPDAVPSTVATLLAVVCLIFLTCVNSYSVEHSIRIHDLLTAIKLLLLSCIVILGIIQLVKENYFWLLPQNAMFSVVETSFASISQAFLQGSFAYSGWSGLVYITEEIADVHRTIPLAYLISIPVVTIFYIMINIAYFTAVSPNELLEARATALEPRG